MEITIGFFTRKVSALILALGFLFLADTDGRAQTEFQYDYGNLCPEEGRFGAVVVQQCPNEGYIYLGYSESTDTEECQSKDVYVVRTDNFGRTTNATISWEKTFDIGGLGGVDTPHGLIEVSDGSGFVIVGTTDLNSPFNDIFLMKLDCDGNQLWTVTYGLINQDEYGYDVFEARTGDGITTNPGDFIIAGSATHPQGFSGTDAYILRVNSGGALIWENRYTEWPFSPNFEERFYSLTDVEPTLSQGVGFQLTGDIVAVGEIDVVGQWKNGYVVRVDGNNGSITAGAPLMQGAATFGGCFLYNQKFICDNEKLLSVVELQNPNERWLYPHVVISGYTHTAVAPEIYLIKLFNGNPNVSTEMLVGDGWTGLDWERGATIREVRHMPAGGAAYAQWDLVLTGHVWANTDPPAPGIPPTDAFLLGINPTLLTPTGSLGMRYGTLNDHEEGWSLDIAPNGSPSRPEGVFIGGNIHHNAQEGNPVDWKLYLLKTDRSGSTQPQAFCEQPYNPVATDPQWSSVEADPWITPHNPIATSYVDVDLDRDWGSELCTGSGKKAGGSETRIIAQPTDRGVAILRMYPQPASVGALLTFEYMPVYKNDVEIVISNAVGKSVYSAKLGGKIGALGRFSLSTTGWPAGAYVVAIRDGNRSITSSLIVTH